MHLTILAYVGNEEDVIEAFVRHHAAFAEAIVCVATGEDRTESILRELAAEGLPVEVRLHRPAFHDQSDVLSRVLRERARSGDWLLPLDADEFLLGDVPAALGGRPSDRPALLPWRTYVPTPDDDEREPNVLRRITHRRAEERPQFRKVLVPGGIVHAETMIAAGNHALEGVAGEESDLPAIAHFPVRSSTQLLRKIRIGWEAAARNPARKQDEAAHWRAMHERFGGRESLDAAELQDIALRYATAPGGPAPEIARDPVPCAFELRHTA